MTARGGGMFITTGRNVLLYIYVWSREGGRDKEKGEKERERIVYSQISSLVDWKSKWFLDNPYVDYLSLRHSSKLYMYIYDTYIYKFYILYILY